MTAIWTTLYESESKENLAAMVCDLRDEVATLRARDNGARGVTRAGVALAMAGAMLLAANVPISGWGYPLFMASSLLLMAAHGETRQWSLFAMQATFACVNAVGIARWLLDWRIG